MGGEYKCEVSFSISVKFNHLQWRQVPYFWQDRCQYQEPKGLLDEEWQKVGVFAETYTRISVKCKLFRNYQIPYRTKLCPTKILSKNLFKTIEFSIVSDKSDEIFAKWRKFWPKKNFVRRKFCPIRYIQNMIPKLWFLQKLNVLGKYCYDTLYHFMTENITVSNNTTFWCKLGKLSLSQPIIHSFL